MIYCWWFRRRRLPDRRPSQMVPPDSAHEWSREPATPAAKQQRRPRQRAAKSNRLPRSSLPSHIRGFSLLNVNLAEVIDALARQLKINYISTEGAGGVTLNTMAK